AAAVRHRRADRARGPWPPHAARRADGQCHRPYDAGGGAAAAARGISRSRRYPAALAAALSRPAHGPTEPRDAAAPQPHPRRDAGVAVGAWISRSQDADAAHDPWWRRGEAVRDAP